MNQKILEGDIVSISYCYPETGDILVTDQVVIHIPQGSGDTYQVQDLAGNVSIINPYFWALRSIDITSRPDYNQGVPF